jgi:Na+-driven multidrug efflux pump
MVFSDGDELINNLGYIFQIGGNIVCSIILAKHYGMLGIIIGSIVGNVLGIIVSCIHFFRKSNTLHFVWYFNIKELFRTARFSIVDAVIYLCWSAMDYVMISYVSAHYGDTGLITLAVVVSLIEFGVVLDGVGMAIQPLLGTYLGEKNHILIKRLIRVAVKAAILEGIIVNVLVIIFARQFCALFGITAGTALIPSITAIRIVSFGLVFCSAVSLFTSYYMLIDHIGLSVAVTVLKDGILYSFLPILGSL